MEMEQGPVMLYIPHLEKKRLAVVTLVLGSFFIVTLTLDILTMKNVQLHKRNETFNITQPQENLDTTVNNTLCAYVSQFRLSEDKRVTVCLYDVIRIDIRRFFGAYASIQGIWLTVEEWNQLLKLWGKIQRAIIAAREEEEHLHTNDGVE